MKSYYRVATIIIFLVLLYLFNLAGHRTDTQRPPSALSKIQGQDIFHRKDLGITFKKSDLALGPELE